MRQGSQTWYTTSILLVYMSRGIPFIWYSAYVLEVCTSTTYTIKHSIIQYIVYNNIVTLPYTSTVFTVYLHYIVYYTVTIIVYGVYI